MTDAELFSGMQKYRVWPDGTVQDAEEAPHAWMSDDFLELWAQSGAEAEKMVNSAY